MITIRTVITSDDVIARICKATIPVREIRHTHIKWVRDELRATGRCICGPRTGYVSKNGVVHGPVVLGGKCLRCVVVHAANSGKEMTMIDALLLELAAIGRANAMEVTR